MYELSLRTPSAAGLAAPPIWIDPRFMLAVGELHQLEALQLLCHKGEQLVAVLPLYEKKNLGLRRLICPMSAYYQGLWFSWEEEREPNRNLLDELKVSGEVASFLKDRYKRMQFNLAPHNQDVRGFTWQGLKAVPYYTFTHISSEELHILKDERKKLRAARQQEYRLVEEFRPEEFIALLKDLYDRKQKRLGVSYAAFQKWMERLQNEDLLSQFNLLDRDRIVSTNLILGGKNDSRGYSIMRSTRPRDLKSGASALHSLLLVDMLKQRFSGLDFCGANYPEVARFKAALGFRLELFFKITG
ncbi:MAG: hypothetical protein PHD87_02505 [Candidatus Cloacimonetes bacterium]|nr:hypothetical protein [Candidatus Cloacimonadota bacterium]